MAHICNCDICHESIVNQGTRCTECEQAVIEDVLFSVKRMLKKNPRTKIPPVLVEKIFSLDLHSIDEYLKIKEGKKLTHLRQGTERELRGLARSQASQKASWEFDRQHPDPDAPTYAASV